MRVNKYKKVGVLRVGHVGDATLGFFEAYIVVLPGIQEDLYNCTVVSGSRGGTGHVILCILDRCIPF